jgi:predicted TIM-barrel fold metal-dependent hydrolase
MSNNPVDIHCHFFNVKFAFRELVEIAWRLAHGDYPYTKGDFRFSREAKKEVKPELDYLLKYVVSLLATAIQDAEHNYQFEQQCYRKGHWNFSAPLITVPLMMDIFFLLDDGSSLHKKNMLAGLPEEQQQRAFGATQVTHDVSDSFVDFAKTLKAEVLQTFEREHRTMNLAHPFPEKHTATTVIEKELDKVIKEFQHPAQETQQGVCRAMGTGVQMTRGFHKHLLELQDLQQKKPGTVMPFLAVDPRRTGINELVKELILPGIFKGIKLYPPLGYLPVHPDLYPIYQLCIEHNIPVTTHTSPGGMKTMCQTISTQSKKQDGTVETKKRHLDKPGEFFAEPNKWLEILQNNQFSDLRINFAHFGGSEAIKEYADFLKNGKKNYLVSANWSYQIIQMMIKFQNVYADFSYCPDQESIYNINTLIEHHPILKERLMFGSDFVMVMKESTMGGLENYFRHCAQMDPAILSTNAQRFLNLPLQPAHQG